ncbi:Tfp pilus assembly protein PilX [Pullulanibacillus pueri]|uniref:Type 4 fimbrial biogenesis protein PilX N-terminal domain-containing protein n=1 Tax=Pullulanibacillus pueri TaxID=1437324 RepID=A0A8J2ZZ02_9BACL|nr:pilus assembly PilX N-terminal domain-containing protein [Pullulanibacillus pueri]MBM7680513.1 Tfp pilus assembly protein PilX [Pullulanibacillus pueri]GGH86079.1 hypothetical protein GCM10007096_32950 [Pullulanibacillus pueri]
MQKGKKSIRKTLQNERGAALAIVLMVIVILSLLGVSLMGLTLTNTKLSTQVHTDRSAYFIAEAGVNLMKSKIKSEVKCGNSGFEMLPEDLDQNYSSKNGDFSLSEGDPEAKVTASQDFSNDRLNYRIESTGTVNRLDKTVTETIQLKCTPNSSSNDQTILNDMAVFAMNKIYFESTINGDIGTNSAKPHSIIVDKNPILNGSINVVDKNVHFLDKKNPEIWRDKKLEVNQISERSYVLPEFPTFPTDLPSRGSISLSGGPENNQTISSDGHYSSITLSSDLTLTIDVGDQNRRIVVDNLNMFQGHIKVQGSGNLALYIGDSFVFGGLDWKNEPTGSGSSSINKEGSSNKVQIYYQGVQPLNLGGSVKVNASIYANNVQKIQLGGSGVIVGDVIASKATEIDIDGGSNSENHFLLAPKATINQSGGAVVNGSIICDTFNLTGGAILNYRKLNDSENLPFFPQTHDSAALEVIPTEPLKEIP